MEFKETELINRYLSGGLSKEEHSAIDRLIQEDPSFKSKVEAHRLVNEMIFTKGLTDVKDKMTKDLATSNPSWTRWLWMGIFLLMAGLGAMYILPGNQWNPKVATPKSMSTPIVEATEEKKSEGTEAKPSVEKVVAIPQNTNSQSLSQSQTSTPQIENLNPEPVAIPEEKKAEPTAPIAAIPEKKVEKSMDNHICDAKTWHFNVTARPTCVGKAEGIIRIQDTESNQYALQTNGIWTSERNFTQLSSGIYTIKIKDFHGCEAKTKVEVLAETCAQSFEVVINPMVGAEMIHVRSSSKGSVLIFSKNGSELAAIPFSENETPAWDGKNKAGQIIERGIYPCWIQYSDHSQVKGVVVISY